MPGESLFINLCIVIAIFDRTTRIKSGMDRGL